MPSWALPLQSLRPFDSPAFNCNLSQKISGIKGCGKKRDFKKRSGKHAFLYHKKNVSKSLCLGRAVQVLFCYGLDNFLSLKGVLKAFNLIRKEFKVFFYYFF